MSSVHVWICHFLPLADGENTIFDDKARLNARHSDHWRHVSDTKCLLYLYTLCVMRIVVRTCVCMSVASIICLKIVLFSPSPIDDNRRSWAACSTPCDLYAMRIMPPIIHDCASALHQVSHCHRSISTIRLCRLDFSYQNYELHRPSEQSLTETILIDRSE